MSRELEGTYIYTSNSYTFVQSRLLMEANELHLKDRLFSVKVGKRDDDGKIHLLLIKISHF